MRSLEAKHHARSLLVLGLKDEDQQEKYAHSVNSLVGVNVCVSAYVCMRLSYVCAVCASLASNQQYEQYVLRDPVCQPKGMCEHGCMYVCVRACVCVCACVCVKERERF